MQVMCSRSEATPSLNSWHRQGQLAQCGFSCLMRLSQHQSDDTIQVRYTTVILLLRRLDGNSEVLHYAAFMHPFRIDPWWRCRLWSRGCGRTCSHGVMAVTQVRRNTPLRQHKCCSEL